MPYPKRKQIYVVFPYNSGAGAEVNQKLMQLYYEYYCKHRDELVAPDESLFIPHIAIDPKTPEPKAMKMCLTQLLRSREVWILRIKTQKEGYSYYSRENSDNMKLEIKLAWSIGLNTYYKLFPRELLPQALELLGMKEQCLTST